MTAPWSMQWARTEALRESWSLRHQVRVHGFLPVRHFPGCRPCLKDRYQHG